MIKTGIVVSVGKRTTCVLSANGEFYNLYIKPGMLPKPGDIYTGELFKSESIFKFMIPLAIIAAAIIILLSIVNYNLVSYTVVLDFNSSLKLQLNKSGTIIRVDALDENGEKISTKINITGSSLDQGLTAILKEAKQQNLLTDSYISGEKKVTVFISSHKSSPAAYSNFEKAADELKINYQINDDGTEYQNPDK